MYNMGVRRQGMELQVMTLPDACSICLLSERFFLVWRMGVSARRVGMSKNEVGSVFFFFSQVQTERLCYSGLCV